MRKILLDANVLLDLLLTRHAEAGYVLSIVKQIEAGRFKGFLSVSILHIIGYWLSREWGIQRAKTGLLVILEHFEVLNANKKTVLSALHSQMTDIEDALQYYTCLEHGMDAIISRDKKFINAAIPGLPVLAPGDFVSKYIEG